MGTPGSIYAGAKVPIVDFEGQCTGVIQAKEHLETYIHRVSFDDDSSCPRGYQQDA